MDVNISHLPITSTGSAFVSKVTDSTITSLSKDVAVFQSNPVFPIITGLAAVFVLFFIVHVITNVHSNFFRRASNSHANSQNTSQARYKSLYFDAKEQDPTVNLEHQAPMDEESEYQYPDSLYLSPVCVNEGNDPETSELQEDDIRIENDVSIQMLMPCMHTACNKEHESSNPLENPTEHFYIEIVEE